MIRKQKKKSLLFVLFCFSILSFGQNSQTKKGDKNFENYSYIEAIKIYENIANQGFVTGATLAKLGDSYYFNGKFSEASKWYNQLFNSEYSDKNLSQLDSEYYYRFGQTLKAIGENQKADEILKRFTEIEANDSRSQLYLTTSEIVEKTKAAASFTLANLSINSEYSDYGPIVMGDQLIFTSSRVNSEMKNKVHNWTNENYTKLYASSIQKDGTFSTPMLYAKEIANKELNMGTAIFSKDGSTMYFTSNRSIVKGVKKQGIEENTLLNIYKVTKQKTGEWGNMVEVPFNSKGSSTAHAAWTPDGKWMYFVSDRPESIGQSDLFRVACYEGGEFGRVESLGPSINTEGRETFPFISDDYWLYFASDGHPGFGGLDLFKAKINSDGSIGVPFNLGPDINSSSDDFALYIDSALHKGFISSNRKGGQGGDDIYMFVEQPCVQNLKGTIYNQDTKELIEKAEIVVFDKTQKTVGEWRSGTQGEYQIDKMLCGHDYRMRISKEGYFTKEIVVKTDRIKSREINIELEPNKVEIQEGDDLFSKLRLNPIYFSFDQHSIPPSAEIELAKVVETMKQHPSLNVAIRSHTDSKGNTKYNHKLSERRAQETMKWIIDRGIDPRRLTAKGYGESQPINHCRKGVRCTDEEHQLNRRSEFIIVEM